MLTGGNVSYPVKTGYFWKTEKSWKKGSKEAGAGLFICIMDVKDYFTV